MIKKQVRNPRTIKEKYIKRCQKACNIYTILTYKFRKTATFLIYKAKKGFSLHEKLLLPGIHIRYIVYKLLNPL